jgi:hypothetical protein
MKLTKGTVAAMALASSVAFVPQVSMGSSHREAPGIAGMPRVDATDFYMFRSYEPGRKGFMTFIANYIPIQAPYGGPNYFTLDPEAAYDIKIDSNGDAVEDMTFRFKFGTALSGGTGIALPVGSETVAIPLRNAGSIAAPGDGTINQTESFRVSLITPAGTAPLTSVANPGQKTFLKPIDNIGTKSIPDYPAYANQHIYDVTIPGCATPGRVFVGQRAEAFAVNLGPIFDLVNLVPIEGDSAAGAGDGAGFPGGITQSRDNDALVGKANVTSLALEVPVSCVTGDGNGVIGAWTTASLPARRVLSATGAATTGPLVQVSRLSNPLVNEVVIGLKDKDKFNGSVPSGDGQFATYVTNPTLPALVNLLFKDAVNTTLGTNIADLAPTNFPRQDLVTAFLTGFPGFNQQQIVTGSEMMRLNTAVPPTSRAKQNSLGLVAEDLAGFPNGRRPGDDTVDIALRVVMGALCHKVPLGAELGVPGAVEDTASDLINLGLCQPSDAAVGNVAFTDGAPISARELPGVFPYLRAPFPGAPS